MSYAICFGTGYMDKAVFRNTASSKSAELLFAIYIVKCCDERRRICADITVQILDKVLFGIAYHDRRTPFHPIPCSIGAFVQPMTAELQTVCFEIIRHCIRNTVHADLAVCA